MSFSRNLFKHWAQSPDELFLQRVKGFLLNDSPGGKITNQPFRGIPYIFNRASINANAATNPAASVQKASMR